MTVVVRQGPATTPDEVGSVLLGVFEAVQAAIADGEPVVLVVDGPALLGQSGPEDSAVACGMLGLARAVAFEGGSKDWRVNVVAVDLGADPDPALVELASSTAGLTGQVLNFSSSAVGKVVP